MPSGWRRRRLGVGRYPAHEVAVLQSETMASSEPIPKLVEECLSVLEESEPGPMVRLLVREALVRIWASDERDEAALTFVRQLEFAADRIEVHGLQPVREILAGAPFPNTRRTTVPTRSVMRFVATSTPPTSA